MRRHLLFAALGLLLALRATAQRRPLAPAPPPADFIAPVGIVRGLSDSALLDVVQHQTFRYF